jgi:hypothetical protein
MTTRKPRRQLSARPTRTTSSSGERYLKRSSVEGWIELLGPNMKKGLFARAAHLPGHSGEGRDPATVFPHFDGA